MVLSPRSLPYAQLALASLFRNCTEVLHLHLITDGDSDKRVLIETLEAALPTDSRHRWDVTAESELADREADRFGGHPNLRAFRHGHPCWRKVTDPMLVSEPGAELVLLDPDLYFPNVFSFETTPTRGLLLMWQRPNCLLPPEVVRAAFGSSVRLARHVDIGVSHWRASADLEWLDWLIGRLGGASLPRIMHIEAIVWAALAMRDGGGYLDPKLWLCWHRTQSKRLLRKLGTSGVRILQGERWSEIKCFHAGGEAKWWLPDAESAGTLRPGPKHIQPGVVQPFVELSPRRYELEQSAKLMLRNLGYYRLFAAG
jgi:hypothetical protein